MEQEQLYINFLALKFDEIPGTLAHRFCSIRFRIKVSEIMLI